MGVPSWRRGCGVSETLTKKVKESKTPRTFLAPDIADYCEAHCSAESVELQALAAFTAEKRADYQVNLSGRSVGQLLKLLVGLGQAKRVLDIGTFTGYSALAMAEATPDDGSVITLDANPLSKDFAAPFLAQSPHGHKVTCVTCFAHEWLAEQTDASFDFIFLDADKHRYPDYLTSCWRLLSEGGLLVADNILWGGHVTSEQRSSRADAVDKFNRLASQLPDAVAVCLPLRDGLMLLRKVG
jgi:caffeoyl-CoA O-methyltransferase